jgi:hypothetical protein
MFERERLFTLFVDRLRDMTPAQVENFLIGAA